MLSSSHFWPPRNFGAIDAELSDFDFARFVVLPAPYDSTTTWRGGTREGPIAILDASMNMELFDRELNCEICDIGIHTTSDIEPDARGPQQMTERVREVVGEVLAARKIPVMLGGEHSLTLGAVQAVARAHQSTLSAREPLTILQLDAHTDLRQTYGGSPFGHGCVARRISEMENVQIIQVGLRSTSLEELEDVPANVAQFWAEDVLADFSEALKQIEAKLSKNLYITFDVDVCDPSWMPDTGTPEPGGLSYYQVRDLLKMACRNREVLGFDCVELIGGHAASAFAVARLLYKTMGYASQDQ